LRARTIFSLAIKSGGHNVAGRALCDDGDTAFAQRQAKYNIGIEAQWIDPAESEKHVAGARAFSDALKLYSSNACLLNFLGDEGPDTVRQAFGINYARQVELKTKYDPTNFFSLNQNVEPRR
jgi:hypothetical protein